MDTYWWFPHLITMALCLQVYRGTWLGKHTVAVKILPLPPSELGTTAVLSTHNELQAS